jgi:hypothetical protein
MSICKNLHPIRALHSTLGGSFTLPSRPGRHDPGALALVCYDPGTVSSNRSWRVPNVRNLWLTCLLLGVASWGQEKPAPPTAQPDSLPPAAHVDKHGRDEEDEAMPASASTVAPDAAVLTIKGLCPEPASAASARPADAPCQTVITGPSSSGWRMRCSRASKPREPYLGVLSQVARNGT